MDAVKVSKIADQIVEVAGQLKSGVREERETQEVFRDIYSLRRSVETLEREVRDHCDSAQGDAC